MIRDFLTKVSWTCSLCFAVILLLLFELNFNLVWALLKDRAIPPMVLATPTYAVCSFYISMHFLFFRQKGYWASLKAVGKIAVCVGVLVMLLASILPGKNDLAYYSSNVGNCSALLGGLMKTSIGKKLFKNNVDILDPSIQYIYYAEEDFCRINNLKAAFRNARRPLCGKYTQDQQYACFHDTIEKITENEPFTFTGVMFSNSLGQSLILKQKSENTMSQQENLKSAYFSTRLTLLSLKLNRTRATPEKLIPKILAMNTTQPNPETIINLQKAANSASKLQAAQYVIKMDPRDRASLLVNIEKGFAEKFDKETLDLHQINYSQLSGAIDQARGINSADTEEVIHMKNELTNLRKELNSLFPN